MTNPPGAMPPLPEPFGHIHDGNGNQPLSFDRGPIPWERSIGCSTQEVYSFAQLQAYAAPLIARVAELERQNEAQKDEWLSWDAKRSALEKDAARYRLVRRGQHWSVIDGIGNTLRADELDKQVDAAIAAKD